MSLKARLMGVAFALALIGGFVGGTWYASNPIQKTWFMAQGQKFKYREMLYTCDYRNGYTGLYTSWRMNNRGEKILMVEPYSIGMHLFDEQTNKLYVCYEPVWPWRHKNEKRASNSSRRSNPPVFVYKKEKAPTLVVGRSDA